MNERFLSQETVENGSSALLYRAFPFLLLALVTGLASAGPEYVCLEVPLSGRGAWGVDTRPCSDGQSARFASTLLNGEQARGVLRSRPFAAPESLGFWVAGASHQDRNFVRLLDAETGEELRRASPPGVDVPSVHTWDLADITGRQVVLVLEDGDNGSGWAWLAVGRFQPEVLAIPDVARAAELQSPDWTQLPYAPAGVPELHTVDGIPFRNGGFVDVLPSGESATLTTVGLQGEFLYLQGCTNSHDVAMPPWGGGDPFKNFFFGDSAGTLTLRYASGVSDAVPLIFGYTAWWSAPYKGSPAPFDRDPEARTLLDAALCVANGIDGFRLSPEDYYLRLRLRPEPLDSIELHDSPKRIGRFEVTALTLAGVDAKTDLDSENFKPQPGGPMATERAAWLAAHTVDPRDPYPVERREAVAALRRVYSTQIDDVTDAVLDATPGEVRPEDFPGPKVTFRGTPTARILTHVYYDNATDLLTRIDDDTGMVHESAEDADNYNGFGGWVPDLGPFYPTAYTRFRGLFLLSNMGFDTKVNTAIGFFDKWLMYFPQSYPDIQLGGKPVPGHATVIANQPHVYFDNLRLVGWPTKYTTRDFGNPENDGHGLLMVSRWHAWVKQGRTKEWIDARWEAIEEAAEYIPWCLDNPDLSFSEHGLLYNESEGGMQDASLYCDFPCYLGLLGYAEMAEATGRADKAERWREQAQRLVDAMEAWYPKQTEEWGEVWDRSKSGGFVHAPLCHAFLGMDYWGYDVMQRLPEKWAQRTRNTYRLHRTLNRPSGACPAGMGYGQGYITQSALLLDEMADASEMVDWTAKLCFAPRLPRPYAVPEGAIIGEGGSVWRRWGDLGNLYQLNEQLVTIQLIVGIDDRDPECLLLMPRLPNDWTEIEATDWPVRVTSHGAPVRARIALLVRRESGSGDSEYTIQSDHALDSGRLRIGPFPPSATSLRVTRNGEKVETPLKHSGDSTWAWVVFGDGLEKRFEFTARVDGIEEN